jgi:hypothetical protein
MLMTVDLGLGWHHGDRVSSRSTRWSQAYQPARRDVLDIWGFIEAIGRLGVARWGGVGGVSDAEAAARALDAVTVPVPPTALPPPPRLGMGGRGLLG